MRIVLPNNAVLDVALNDGPAAAQLAACLPVELTLSRWGDGEYYGTLPSPIVASEKRREHFAVGEVALWPDGNAFCLFFGPTPASVDARPKMASPGISLGRIVSGTATLAGLGPSIRVRLQGD